MVASEWMSRRASTVVRIIAVAAVVAGLAATASASVPSIGGEIEPAWLGNGDGSVILGGFDGTGRGGNFGHIRWTTWSATKAVGWAAEWDRGVSPEGPFRLHSTRALRVRATHPSHGVFMRLSAFGCEVWRGPGVGYYPVRCSTWRQ